MLFAGFQDKAAHTLSYDPRGIVTVAEGGREIQHTDRNGSGERYAYELCGNRLLKEQYVGSSVDVSEGYRYNERNELTERVSAGSLTRYRYDKNGSIISEEEEGRKSEYRYDLLNRQTYVRTLEGKEQENLYDGEGVPTRRYLRGIVLSYVQTGDGVYHAYHQDEQGSTAYITGQGRETENIYQYDAFGKLTEQKEGFTNRILYTGQQYDQETGQYYLRARYYNPVVGRLLQEDTYQGDGMDLYAYCANNPVVYYDPSGHGKIICNGDGANENIENTKGNKAVNGNDVAPNASRTTWGAEHGRGNVAHNNAIEDELDQAFANSATDIRKNRV